MRYLARLIVLFSCVSSQVRPSHLSYILQLAHKAYGASNHEQAKQLWTEVGNQNSDLEAKVKALYMLLLVNKNSTSGTRAESFALCKQIIKIAPEIPEKYDAYAELAILYVLEGKYEKGKNKLRFLAQSAPDKERRDSARYFLKECKDNFAQATSE